MDSAKNFVYAMHKPISNSLSNSSLSPTPTLHFTLPSTSNSPLRLRLTLQPCGDGTQLKQTRARGGKRQQMRLLANQQPLLCKCRKWQRIALPCGAILIPVMIPLNRVNRYGII